MAVLKTTSPSPRPSKPSAAPAKARPSSRTSAAWRFSDGNDHRLVDAVLLGDENLDPLCVRRGYVLTDIVRTDGQLAMSSVDQHRQLDSPWPSEVHERIHRRACGPAVVDDIVDEHDRLAVDVGHVGLAAVSRDAQMPIVAVLADVEGAHGDRRPFELHQAVRQATREVVSFGHHADQHKVAGAAVALEDLVRDARKRAPDLLGVHHPGFEPPLLYCAHASSLSSSAMRMYRPLRA